MLEELYQETILELSRSQEYRGDLKDQPHACDVCMHNPLCGDCVHLWIEPAADGVLGKVRFCGHGCSISQASATMMAALIEGRDAEFAKQLIEDFKLLLSGKLPEDDPARVRLDHLVALEGVRRFPARQRCAALAFDALTGTLNRLAEHQEPRMRVTSGCCSIASSTHGDGVAGEQDGPVIQLGTKLETKRKG